MLLKFKFKPNATIPYLGLIVLSLFSVEVYAMNGTTLTSGVTDFLTTKVINNVGTVGVLAATILGAVAAFGQKISQFILNNLAYVAYVAFGATLSTGALRLAGMTI
jgi:hypothetical protein